MRDGKNSRPAETDQYGKGMLVNWISQSCQSESWARMPIPVLAPLQSPISAIAVFIFHPSGANLHKWSQLLFVSSHHLITRPEKWQRNMRAVWLPPVLFFPTGCDSFFSRLTKIWASPLAFAILWLAVKKDWKLKSGVEKWRPPLKFVLNILH